MLVQPAGLATAALSLARAEQAQRASREHFAVVTAKVLSLDWLELHADGHRRARFGPGSAQWLQP